MHNDCTIEGLKNTVPFLFQKHLLCYLLYSKTTSDKVEKNKGEDTLVGHVIEYGSLGMENFGF